MLRKRPAREVEIEDEEEKKKGGDAIESKGERETCACEEEREREHEERRRVYRDVSRYTRVCACARFGAGGHTFNFARPITKSDMHHSEINSQQQRAHVLFVMSRSNSPERVEGEEA